MYWESYSFHLKVTPFNFMANLLFKGKVPSMKTLAFIETHYQLYEGIEKASC